MNTDRLIVCDNFTGAAQEIRQRALALDFADQTHNGHTYSGIGLGYSPPVHAKIEELVGFPIKTKLEFFRSGTTAMRPSTFIHADMNECEFAGVLYLNEPHQNFGGTAFWMHKKLRWDEIPPGFEITPEFADQLNADGQDETRWNFKAFISMKLDRFITYPSRRFHSRWPNNVEADSVANGRLVWCIFYDRK